jgi:hypothetical protein
MAKTVLHSPVMTKARKRWGQNYPAQATEHNAEVTVGESIRIWGEMSKRPYEQTFKVGDVAVYGSYNLIYTGTIVSIGAKTVAVRHYEGDTTVTQMDINTFCNRNWDYDAARIADRNADTMMYI